MQKPYLQPSVTLLEHEGPVDNIQLHCIV